MKITLPKCRYLKDELGFEHFWHNLDKYGIRYGSEAHLLTVDQAEKILEALKTGYWADGKMAREAIDIMTGERE